MNPTVGAFIIGVIILVMILAIKANVVSPGISLQKKFIGLGNMTALSKQQIIDSVGAPNSITNIQGGQLLQWQATGYSMAIIFNDEGKFIKIHKEYVARS